ncbi:MAG: ABC transporter permease [Deltaproteobacteria bacterium]|nr:ABC transporter permease [Deltaproteobacteria bacterium]
MTASASLKTLFIRIKNQPTAGLYLGVLLLITFLMIVLPQFRTARNLTNILLRAVPLLAVGTGQTMVLLGAGIDLSVGAVLALSTTVASVTLDTHVVGGIFLALITGMLVGLFNGLGVTKLRINPFLMTIGTTIITGGIALYIRPYPGGIIPREYVDFVLARVGVFPVTPSIVFVVIVICGILILRKTRFGRHLYAVGGNVDAARLAGIHTDLVLIGTYVGSGFFAALAGLYMTARISCGDPAVGMPYQMDSITTAVLGGTTLTGGRGGMEGTVIGVILLAMLGNIFNLMDINIYWQHVLRGVILVGVVVFSQLRSRKLKKAAAMLQ